MRALCVYCGSSTGREPLYAEMARELASVLVSREIGLVYGGGNIGLMGNLANRMLELGGNVTGVIPQQLMDMEVGHLGLTRLHVVKDMHERKAKMAELSDGFIALPGGIGTLEELFEMFTWAQLGLHQKPIGLLNVAGFYDRLLQFLDYQVEQGFLKHSHRMLLLTSEQPVDLINLLFTTK